MNRHVSKRLFLVAVALGVLAVFAMGFFVALGVRSVVAGPDSAPAAQVPVVSHTYDQIELPAGTWTGLDADTVDGLSSNQIHDADDYVSSAGNADMVDGYHASQLGGGGCYTRWSGSCPAGFTQVDSWNYMWTGHFDTNAYAFFVPDCALDPGSCVWPFYMGTAVVCCK